MNIFITPSEILNKLAVLVRERRVAEELTQQDLAAKANVSLSAIRKYEQTGHISMASFVKVAYVLDLTDSLLAALESQTMPRKSIDEIIKRQQKSNAVKGTKRRVRNK